MQIRLSFDSMSPAMSHSLLLSERDAVTKGNLRPAFIRKGQGTLPASVDAKLASAQSDPCAKAARSGHLQWFPSERSQG